MNTAAIRKTKAERTSAQILAAAENHFSRLGFAATRLDDIAEELGLTRAALFYYFKDKQTLYDATITHSFSDLAYQLETQLCREDGSVTEKIEAASGAWVDAILARPNLARLIMRFIADGTSQPVQRIFQEDDQIPLKFLELFESGRRSGELKPLQDDPFHAASALIGTTVFYASALSTLLPQEQFEPLDPKQAAAHRRDVLASLRTHLGMKTSQHAPT